MEPVNESMSDDEPLYNIGVVSRMTGIPETNLRIWERRYDFPESARTTGGHRLYSQREVLRLQWVKQRVEEGMQISQAIRTLQHMEREGRFPDAPLTALGPAIETSPDDTPLDVYHKRLTSALIDQNLELADQILAEAAALHALEAIILEVVGPAFADIGDAWLDGRISVTTEHFVTNHLRHHLLMWMQTAPPPHAASPIVLACAPGELHEGSLLILGVLLRRMGWPVIYLGQSVPLEDLAGFVEETRPAVVVLVAMTEPAVDALREWPRWMPEAATTHRPTVVFGGWIFGQKPEMANNVPGLYLGNDLRNGVHELNRIMREANPLAH